VLALSLQPPGMSLGIRKLKERDAAWTAARVKRETTMEQAMSALEVRLISRLAGQKEFVFEVLQEACAIFYHEQIVKLICGAAPRPVN